MAVHFLSEKFHLVMTSYWWVITYLFRNGKQRSPGVLLLFQIQQQKKNISFAPEMSILINDLYA